MRDEVRRLLGPNGAGKTTLISVLTGMCVLRGGHMAFPHGRPIRHMQTAVRHVIGRRYPPTAGGATVAGYDVPGFVFAYCGAYAQLHTRMGAQV